MRAAPRGVLSAGGRASAGRASRPPAPRREFRWCPTRSSRASPGSALPGAHHHHRRRRPSRASSRASVRRRRGGGGVHRPRLRRPRRVQASRLRLRHLLRARGSRRASPRAGHRREARRAIRRGGQALPRSRLPRPDRRPRPHFDRCGGCTWQDLAYPAQLRLKRDQVLDVVTRIAKISAPAAEARSCATPSLSPSLFRYRNKMEFAFVAGSNPDAPARVGLRPSNDHDSLVEVVGEGDGVGCLLQHPTADEVLRRVARFLRRGSSAARALPAFDRRTGAGVPEASPFASPRSRVRIRAATANPRRWGDGGPPPRRGERRDGPFEARRNRRRDG